MRICINCENEDSVVVCLICSSFHYCCNDCKNEYERSHNVLCPDLISNTLSVSGLILPDIIRASSYSLPALPQSTLSRNLPSIGNNISPYQHRQESSTQLPIYSGHLSQPSSGSFILPTLVQSTVSLNQPRTSGSIQLPAIIAPRINSSSPTLTNIIQRLPVPGSRRLPSLVTETSQQELPWDMRTPRNFPHEVRCAQRLEDAKEFFNNGQYVEALDLLEQIKIELSNHEGSTSWVLKYTIDSYIERIDLLTISD
jgi:hypothetical protein